MNFKRIFSALFGWLLFFSGVLISLALSGNLLWGEIEARLYAQQSGEKGLEVDCPLIIAPWETATIGTVITNTLGYRDTSPQVNAFISTEKEARVVSQTLKLGPLESKPLQWTADRSDVVFGRLILVNILQRPYRDLASRQGACSILVFTLFGLTGNHTLGLMISAGILCSLLGTGLLIYLYQPFTDFTKKVVQINVVFTGLVLAGLISALPRLWGLTLFLDGFALLTFMILISETLIFPKK